MACDEHVWAPSESSDSFRGDTVSPRSCGSGLAKADAPSRWDFPSTAITAARHPAFTSLPGQFFSEGANPTSIRIDPRLPCAEICNPQGRIAVLVGHGVHGDGFIRDRVEIEASDFAGLERWRHRLLGRFIMICEIDGESRLYPDASASMGIVYSERLRRFASTTGLLPRPEPGVLDEDLIRFLDRRWDDSWYPFGLTERRDARRLLPNHYLDLGTFSAVRFRPAAADAESTVGRAGPPKDTVRRIFAVLQDGYRGFADAFDCVLTLTAGLDSRILLAAALATGRKPRCYTYEAPDGCAYIDVIIAGNLCRRLGIEYRTFPFLPPTEADLELWQTRIGRCVGGRVGQSVTSMRAQLVDSMVLVGKCGEVARGELWTADDLQRSRGTAAELLDRLRLPHHPRFLESAATWMAEVPSTDWRDILDQAFIELRLGCWAGPQGYGAMHSPGLSLFNSELVFDLFLSLPKRFRFELGVAEEVLLHAPRPLGLAPINRVRRIDEVSFALSRPRSYLRIRRKIGLKLLRRLRPRERQLEQ